MPIDVTCAARFRLVFFSKHAPAVSSFALLASKDSLFAHIANKTQQKVIRHNPYLSNSSVRPNQKTAISYSHPLASSCNTAGNAFT